MRAFLLSRHATCSELERCGLGGCVHSYGDGNRAAALASVRSRGGVLLTSYGMVLHNAAEVRATEQWAWMHAQHEASSDADAPCALLCPCDAQLGAPKRAAASDAESQDDDDEDDGTSAGSSAAGASRLRCATLSPTALLQYTRTS